MHVHKDAQMQSASRGKGENTKVDPDIQSRSKHHKH